MADLSGNNNATANDNATLMLLASNQGAGTYDWVRWPGGTGNFSAEATWGGGSAKLQKKMPNGTAADITGASLTANGDLNFTESPCQIRLVVATATGVYAQVRRIYND